MESWSKRFIRKGEGPREKMRNREGRYVKRECVYVYMYIEKKNA